MRSASIAILLAAAGLSACAGVDQSMTRARSRIAAVAAPACSNFSFPLYFQTGSDQLTRDGLAVVDNYSARVRACKVDEVKVTGLADAQGEAANNMELSQRRATSVAQVLSARGYPTPTFDVAAQGEAGASTTAGRAEPLRRRAEVSVRFASATPTSR